MAKEVYRAQRLENGVGEGIRLFGVKGEIEYGATLLYAHACAFSGTYVYNVLITVRGGQDEPVSPLLHATPNVKISWAMAAILLARRSGRLMWIEYPILWMALLTAAIAGRVLALHSTCVLFRVALYLQNLCCSLVFGGFAEFLFDEGRFDYLYNERLDDNCVSQCVIVKHLYSGINRFCVNGENLVGGVRTDQDIKVHFGESIDAVNPNVDIFAGTDISNRKPESKHTSIRRRVLLTGNEESNTEKNHEVIITKKEKKKFSDSNKLFSIFNSQLPRKRQKLSSREKMMLTILMNKSPNIDIKTD